MVKYKMGAIIKEVPKGSEKWYKMAGWKKLETSKKEDKNDKKRFQKKKYTKKKI